jgi:glycosyltransferase involved in cell wall biosynthesis/GT2 family glycosyltransferase
MSRGGVSVIIPTYRRPDYLCQCLEALRAQSVPPDDVLIVRRADDAETETVLRNIDGDHLAEIVVNEVGVVAALAAGVRAASSDIVAFVDDDAVPHRDWLGRIMSHFDDREVGAVGGRDIVQDGHHAKLPLTTDVGRIGRWGKMRGNHHLGAGPARDVMILKGANMAFRREAIAFPESLRGKGAQVHFEVAMCLWALAQRWRLVYDPAAIVDHFVGPRFDADRRGLPERQAVRDAAYNYVAALLSQRPELFWRRAAYGLLVGDRGAPGLLRATAALLRRDRNVVRRLRPSVTGQAEALWLIARGRSISMVPVVKVDRRPKVALVAHDVHDQGGMERALAELIRLGHRRVHFVVVSRQLAPELRPLVDWRRVPVPARPFPLKFSLFFLMAAGRLLFLRADVVHTMGAIVPSRTHLASVQFCHAAFRGLASGAPGHSSRARRVNARVSSVLSLAAERWLYRPGRAKALAAVSRGVEAELRRQYPDVPVVLTPNAVDTDRFRPDPDARRRMRLGGRLGSDEVVALFVGGDWKRKGVAIAIEGFAQAARECDVPLRLWVVGRGDAQRYRRVAEIEGVSDRVTFFGPRSDTERFFQAADLFVFPTLYEAFPLAVLEAAACGLPLVVTAVNGVDELLGDNGDSGIVVQRTPESAAKALVRLADSPGLRAEMGHAARVRAQEFTWPRSVQSILDTYSAFSPVPSATAEPA